MAGNVDSQAAKDFTRAGKCTRGSITIKVYHVYFVHRIGIRLVPRDDDGRFGLRVPLSLGPNLLVVQLNSCRLVLRDDDGWVGILSILYYY